MYTKKICSFPPIKITGSLSVYPGLPVSICCAMALSTEQIGFREDNEFPICELQFISIRRIMAVEAPSHAFSMVQLDVYVFILELSLRGVSRNAFMAGTAWENSL